MAGWGGSPSQSAEELATVWPWERRPVGPGLSARAAELEDQIEALVRKGRGDEGLRGAALAEGKSIRKVKRCLKRYVARQLFRQLPVLPEGLDRT